MKNTSTLYIAYGSNMNIAQMAQRCLTAKPVANSWLEGYPRLYRKETVWIKLGKKKYPAMIYIMNGDSYSYGLPSKTYFDTICDGYLSAGFDPKLLHQAVAENMKGEFAYDDI